MQKCRRRSFFAEDILQLYLNIGNLQIPSYGFLIALGIVIANTIVLYVLHKMRLDSNDFIILEAYCILGAFFGAKILYLMISHRDIEWNRILELSYFNALMQSGFVFYGGLIGGLLFVFMAGKIHNIIVVPYIKNFIFLIPFIHSFGRIGCFMAGCCYGKPYDGVFAVMFPEGSFAPSGISLFPVQLLEAMILMAIALLLLYLQAKIHWYYTVETYLILYGITRFLTEFLRYDEARGVFANLSTSQWISIGIVLVALFSILLSRREFRS